MGRRAAWRGLNERFRFYRYATAQKFDWHVDGPFERSNGERSQLTLLNLSQRMATKAARPLSTSMARSMKCAATGATSSYSPHRLRHRGSVVTAGTKYMLRTDVMYYPLVGAGQSSFPSLDTVRAMAAGART